MTASTLPGQQEERAAARQDWLARADERAAARRDAPGALPATPFELPGAVVAQVQTVATALAAGAAAVLRVRHGGAAAHLARATGRSEFEVRQLGAAAERSWPPTIFRPDVHIGPDGTVQVFEPNFTSAIGGLGEHDSLVEHFARHPAAQRPEVKSGPGVRRLAAAIRSRLPDGGGLVVVSDWRAYLIRRPGQAAQAHALVRHLRRHGIDAEVVATEDLAVRDGAVHEPSSGRRVAVLYRFFDEQPEDSPRAPHLTALLDVVDRGSVTLVDGLIGQLALTKAVLADLSDPEVLAQLPAATAATLAASVPWTRRVADVSSTDPDRRPVDLLPYAARHREHLLLKPADGYGGAGVVFGAETTDAAWSGRIADVLADPAVWLVQQVVDTRSSDLVALGDGKNPTPDGRADFGAYVVDGRLAAIVRRTTLPGADQRLIKGGGMAPVVSEPGVWS